MNSKRVHLTRPHSESKSQSLILDTDWQYEKQYELLQPKILKTSWLVRAYTSLLEKNFIHYFGNSILLWCVPDRLMSCDFMNHGEIIELFIIKLQAIVCAKILDFSLHLIFNQNLPLFKCFKSITFVFIKRTETFREKSSMNVRRYLFHPFDRSLEGLHKSEWIV